MLIYRAKVPPLTEYKPGEIKKTERSKKKICSLRNGISNAKVTTISGVTYANESQMGRSRGSNKPWQVNN
mgnify:CR=1 FL=1